MTNQDEYAALRTLTAELNQQLDKIETDVLVPMRGDVANTQPIKIDRDATSIKGRETKK